MPFNPIEALKEEAFIKAEDEALSIAQEATDKLETELVSEESPKQPEPMEGTVISEEEADSIKDSPDGDKPSDLEPIDNPELSEGPEKFSITTTVEDEADNLVNKEI